MAGVAPAQPNLGANLDMIRHIVLFSAKNPLDIDTIHQALSKLKAIPHARHLEVSRNARKDDLSTEIDLVVYAEFDDYDRLERYKAHPLYRESVAIVRPLRELRIAVDYETSGPSSGGDA
jgi:hypothetical protein